MLGKAKQRWHSIFYQTATDWSEFFSAMLALILSIAFLLSSEQVFATAPRVYSPMQWLLPARGWVLVFLSIAACQLLALFRGNMLWRIRMAFVTTCFWLFIAMLFALGDIRALGLWLYTLHAFSTARVYLNLSRLRTKGRDK